MKRASKAPKKSPIAKVKPSVAKPRKTEAASPTKKRKSLATARKAKLPNPGRPVSLQLATKRRSAKPRAAEARKTERRKRAVATPRATRKRPTPGKPVALTLSTRRKAKPATPVRTKAALERLLARERAACRKLERRLTDLVQELGQVRHYEARARALEEELRRRDEELATYRRAAGTVRTLSDLAADA